MPEPKRPLKVFLCHASQDKPVIRELSRRLVGEGWIDTWLDEKKLLPGQDWRLAIEEAVEDSDIVIICLSVNSVNKEGHVQKELRYAREMSLEKPEETIFLIPLRLDECEVPRGLRFYQWVDYFGEKREDTYTALLESLKIRHEQKLKLEEKERVRLEKERLEREASEKAAREKAEREIAERKAREEVERAAAEKAKREKAEREAVERIAREKAKREAAEKARQVKKERLDAQKAALAKMVSNSFTSLKSSFSTSKPFVRIVSFTGIAIALLLGGVLTVPNLLSLMPTATPSSTITPSATFAPPTKTPAPTSTKTRVPTATLSPTVTLTPTPIPTDRFLLQEDFEDNNANGWIRYEAKMSIEQEPNRNHYLSLSGPSGYPHIFYENKTLHWTDYAFESRIKFVEGSNIDFAIAVHIANGTFYKLIAYNRAVNFFYQDNSGGYLVYGTWSPKIFVLNQWYIIRVEIKGVQAAIYIDNVLVDKYQLDNPLLNSQGGIGYLIVGGEKIYIDDIKVWSLK